MTEESLFLAALDQTTAAARQAFLAQACGRDDRLRRRLLRLLAADEQTSGILDRSNELDSTWKGSQETRVRHPVSEPLLGGRYRVLDCVGEGGMGTVWVAEQVEPVRRKVALKLIKPGIDSRSVILRFEAERQALALMDHPHIAKVFDGGVTDDLGLGMGRPFFAMEFVPGVPLTQFCDDNRLTVAERLQLFLLVCQAVQHAHQKGIVHRDFKPSNILVGMHDGKPVPKVIDFGLAKALHAPLTEDTLQTAAGLMLGTPLYMSPEQAEPGNADIDTRSDIYSLGVILYELLTGSTPMERQRLQSATWEELLHAIRIEEPPAPSTRLSSSDVLPGVAAQRRLEPPRLQRLLRGDLDWIALKCLEKDRTRRYAAVSGLAQDIERHLNDEPVAAGPPSAVYRWKKFLRRHRAPVAAGAVFLLLLLGGIVGTTWGMLEAENARQAEQARADGETKARQQAEEEKQRAEQAKQIAEAMRDFLGHDLLLHADLWQQEDTVIVRRHANPEARVTVRDLLDRAAQRMTPARLEARFPGQPLVQAEVLHVIGFAYRRIGEHDKAIAHLERSRALFLEHRGPNHLDTLAVTLALGLAHLGAGHGPEGVRLVRRSSDGTFRLLGADHPFTRKGLLYLARAYHHTGNLRNAIRVYEYLAKLSERTLGLRHADTLLTMNNLACVYQEVERLDEAIRLYEQVRDVQLAQHGLDHPETLATLVNLAAACKEAGRTDEAVRLLEQVWDTQSRFLPANAPVVLLTLENLADAYQQAGRLPQAIRLFEQVRDDRLTRLGSEDPATLTALNNLAAAYQDAGRLADALAVWREAVPAAWRVLGLNDPRTEWITGNWIRCLEAGKLHDQAMQAAREWLAAEFILFQGRHPRQALPLELLGSSLLKTSRAAEAEAVLRESLALRDKYVPDLWSTYQTRSLLGQALLDQHRLASAEPLLLQGHAGLSRHQARLPPQCRRLPLEALERLVALYDRWGKPELAAKWRQEAEAWMKQPRP